MVSDLISRDKLLGDLYAEWLLCTPDTPTFINGELQRCEKAKLIEEGMKLVENQPTVDAVEVVHGEWIRHGYKWRCSKCDEKINVDGTPYENGLYYCPHCGAKMDGRNEQGEKENG